MQAATSMWTGQRGDSEQGAGEGGGTVGPICASQGGEDGGGVFTLRCSLEWNGVDTGPPPASGISGQED